MYKKNFLIVFLLSIFIVQAQNPFDDVSNFYHLDNSTISDVVGTDHAQYVTSVSVAEGVVNGSHAFGGSEFITLFYFAPPSFTINLWFKTDDTTKNQRVFHRGGRGGSSYDRYSYSMVYIPGQGFRFSLGNDSGSNAVLIYANPSIDVTDWHMITCSYNQTSQTAKIYIDGSLIASDLSTESYYSSPAYQPYLQFSRYHGGDPQGVDGNIDEIGLWRRALTDSEVTQVYNQQGTLDINEFNLDNKSEISLYPNPAKNRINIVGSNESQEYSIFNMVGEKVETGVIDVNKRIDINMLSKGVYILRFDDKIKPVKFIKE